MVRDIGTILASNPYPGRGIILGLCPGGTRAMLAYFIMGRSENSRNRVFTQHDGGLLTEPADPAKVADPSLILYTAVRRHGDMTIVTNGDQTDTIYEHLVRGESFEAALNTRSFEPDAPNYTPRISGLLSLGFEGFAYKLSILKSALGDAAGCQRFFYHYDKPVAGQGHFIHTYAGNGDPLPSFYGEPAPIAVQDDIDAYTQKLWAGLNEENKIALFVRTITLEGDEETRVMNRYNKI